MTDYPKVSVVTITYGHEHYITQTLESILMQKYSGEIEFIIANDNSPDKTHEVVNNFLIQNAVPSNFEIKYTQHPINKGMMPNFVWALEQTTGKYIALCEGDDYWTDPLKLQKQVDFLEGNYDYSMVFTNADVQIEFENGQSNDVRGLEIIQQDRIYTALEIFENWTVPTATVVYRNNFDKEELLIYLSNENFAFGDIVNFLFLSKKGKIWAMKDYTALYRRHIGGVTNFQTTIQQEERLYRHVNEVLKCFGPNLNGPNTRNNLAQWAFSLALHNFHNGKYRLGAVYFLHSVKSNPQILTKFLKNKIMSWEI